MTNKYQSLFDRQCQYFNTDATKPLAWRLEQLNRMEKMLNENRDRFCAALYDDFRKPSFEQQMEITVPLGVIDYYRKNLESLMAPEERNEMLDNIERAYMRISREIESRSPQRRPDDLSREYDHPSPPENGESIGAYLKHRREHLGLTLRDIASRTRIRTTFLEHIENGRLSDLPAPVYLRGFVLEFAKVLDLPNPEMIADAYLKPEEEEDE